MLTSDDNHKTIQAFPLVKGKTNKTTGTFEASMIACVSDGDVSVVGDTISMTAGDVFSFTKQNVTITTGTYHLA